MHNEGIFRRRNLPHWDVAGKPVFITGCLAGSISSAGFKRIEQYRDELDQRPKPDELTHEAWDDRKHKLFFKFVDHLLDHHSPVRHLVDDRQAKIVQDAFFHFAEDRYKLIAFVVMPSHHHWLFLPDAGWKPTLRLARRTPREIISHSIQSYTASQCNKILQESGQYWQAETFDHWARTEEEMWRIIHYIEHNPVVSGLVERPEQYLHSSAYLRAKFQLEFDAPLLKIHNR